MKILGVDVGTTAMKMGVFVPEGDTLRALGQFSREYPINTYNDGTFSDIEPEKWQQAFAEGCQALGDTAADVDVIALSGTTPGLTAMDPEGRALYPAILFLDQRSRTQARQIIDEIGLPRLLADTANMPVAGGCSLASILWLKEAQPDVFRKTACFGHSNTVMTAWLTGRFAIDPSSASLTALYNTVPNDLSWNAEIAAHFGIDLERLPPVMPAFESPGRLKPELARRLGLAKEPPVVIGGNDAVLAAYSLGIEAPGQVVNVNGTCEISMVCLPQCYPSPNYNIRAHVIPERWFSFFVMNAEGKAFEWFRSLFCTEMSPEDFYGRFMPAALDRWVDRDTTVTYVPFLLGSRYSQQPLKAEFLGLTAETAREELLAALAKGLCRYQREHLKEISLEVPLDSVIHVTGGAVSPELIRAKTRWMRNCRYVFREQSSLMGAARLGQKHLRAAGGA
jgi:sugar (pentulose or hexulose) kinase